MIRGITNDEVPSLTLKEYTDLDDAKSYIFQFLRGVKI